LPDEERAAALPDARNYLESAINAGLVPAVELIDSGWRASLTNINDEIERQVTASYSRTCPHPKVDLSRQVTGSTRRPAADRVPVRAGRDKTGTARGGRVG
jgi:hypothetical protein